MAREAKPRDEETPNPAAKQDDGGGSLRQAFPGHFRPTTEEFDLMWGEGMFVVDTNVLLNLYEYSLSTRSELLGVLRALKDKLFLPHQVGREFLDRRLSTIRKQRQRISKLRGRVTGVRQEMVEELRNVLRLHPGEELPKALQDALNEVPPGGYEALAERLEALETDLPRASNSPEDDEIWSAVEGLINGKVGPPYQHQEMRETEEEAERRRGAKIPPGFKDERPGDYVLWRQTIAEAKRSGRPVVLVTDDRKEDWWWSDQDGKTIGPRPELVAEIQREAGVLFYMYTPDRLMEAARERLNVQVSDESISEAEGFGREAGDDDAAGESRDPHLVPHELFDALRSLTDIEKRALDAYKVRGSIHDVVEEVGGSYIDAYKLVDRLLARETYELAKSHGATRVSSVFDPTTDPSSVEFRQYALERPEGHINRLSVAVRGHEDGLVHFAKSLLKNIPEVETVRRKAAASAVGDAAFEVRFRPSMARDRATSALEETARASGIALSLLGYGNVEHY